MTGCFHWACKCFVFLKNLVAAFVFPPSWTYIEWVEKNMELLYKENTVTHCGLLAPSVRSHALQILGKGVNCAIKIHLDIFPSNKICHILWLYKNRWKIWTTISKIKPDIMSQSWDPDKEEGRERSSSQKAIIKQLSNFFSLLQKVAWHEKLSCQVTSDKIIVCDAINPENI